MKNHLVISSSMVLFIHLSACGGVTVEEDTSCFNVDVTKTLLIPVLPSAETSSSEVSFSGLQCLDRAPDLDASGRADCVVIAARRTTDTPTCDPSDGLVAVTAEHWSALERLLAGDDAKSHGWNELCEVVQLDPESVGGQACRRDTDDAIHDENGLPVRGFCYVDTVASPALGNPEILTGCPSKEKRGVRVTGTSAMVSTTESKSLTIVCSNEVCPGP